MNALYVASLNLGILALVFVPLERVFSAREQPILRPHLVADVCFFLGQYFVTNAATLAVLGALGSARRATALAAAPAVVQVVVAIVLGDLLVYWFHRACHRFEVLWRFHAVHHTSEHLDWVAAHREHPVDGVLTALCMNLPAIVLGVRPELLAGVAVFRGMWAIFVHANTRVPLGALRLLLGAPELHHFHHAKRETTYNYANLAPWIDRLFGTYRCPTPNERYELGIDDAHPKGYFGLVLWPVVRDVSRMLRRLTVGPARSRGLSSRS